MAKDSIKKYLSNFSESLTLNAPTNRKWLYTLVIPAYRESKSLFNTLESLPTPSGGLLVILVINKPSWDQQGNSNKELRFFLDNLQESAQINDKFKIKFLKTDVDILVVDYEKVCEMGRKCNVGLARKIGFDLALAWHSIGAIGSDWLSSTDADAILPPDYFERIERADAESKAICWPFSHMPSNNDSLDAACKLYVSHIHHYTLGLSYAKSPFSYHSLGSCISVRARAYAEVRGFPRRAGGEDFYMLNKLRKVGKIECLTGQCISITTRESDRVPFGTGPAITKLIDSQVITPEYRLYNPNLFAVLKAVINSAPNLWKNATDPLRDILKKENLSTDLAIAAEKCLIRLGITNAITHCREHASSETIFLKHFLIWFDAFRTLKFIHTLEDSHLPKILLKNYHSHLPLNWPIDIRKELSLDDLLSAHRKHLDWNTMDPSHW